MDGDHERAVWVLGLNSAYHEPSACLLRDGELVAAVEEERFNRVRHGKVADLTNPHWLPERSIRYCLDAAGIGPDDLSLIGYSFDPARREAYNVGVDVETVLDGPGTAEREGEFRALLEQVPSALSTLLKEDVSGRFRWVPHHLCHAASAFYASPFDEAAILSVDGIGEATSTWLGVGRGTKIDALREIPYPNSLGFLWTKASRFLGFGEYGQWKVMGLAGYGDPSGFYSAFRKFVSYDDEGQFTVDPRYLQFRTPSFKAFEELFGPPRDPREEIEDRHKDFAAALQKVTNEAMLSFARWLHRTTGLRKLCQAGGVALNCIANRVVLEEGPFDETFIQPAANDAGTALGAAWYLWHHQGGHARGSGLAHVYLGPAADPEQTKTVLVEADEESVPDGVESEVARLLAAGEVVAWFQGRMEFGPRALGNRSFLADPRRPEVVHVLNDRVKHREFFRPFAASVLDERADDWFLFPKPSVSDAFMLYARRLRPERLGSVPAVTHVDGTSRVQRVYKGQNPSFHRLLSDFERLTGVPLLLNTSFNDSEPIICTPGDAVATCRRGGLRWLAIDGHLVDLGTSVRDGLARNVSGAHTTDRYGPWTTSGTHVEATFRSRFHEDPTDDPELRKAMGLAAVLPFRSR